MPNTIDLESQLGQFIGTEHYCFNPLYPWMKYTDGVAYFAEHAGCHWFLDILGTELAAHVRRNPFMAITMSVKDSIANIVVTDGKDNNIWSRKEIYTDCPAGNWKFFLTDKVLMLTSEY